MHHSNIGEVHQLLSTYNRVRGAGGEASLSLKTVDGKVSAVLEVQLGSPTSLRPGAHGIVVLDARHGMLLGRKPGGSAVWKASSPNSHHHLLLNPQQTTLR